MPGCTLVLPEPLATQLRGMLAEPRESAAVLLLGSVTAEDGARRLLARELHPVPERAYARRERAELLVTSEGWAPALARAEQLGASALWFHTHPGANTSAKPSSHDERVDEQLAEPFRIRTGSDLYSTLILSGSPENPRFTGRLGDADQQIPIERLWEVGERLRLRTREGAARPAVQNQLFDRNIRAFGSGIQQTLATLSVALVGAGGIGSAVGEQLLRLGVRDITILDPDVLSASNLTRVYGSTPDDVGRPKAEALATHLQRIAPDAKIAARHGSLTEQHGARAVAGADVTFGCTDDNAGRLVLSRIASYLLTPVIDCGVLLSSGQNGKLTGIDGRITVLWPGAACLVCRDRVDLARAQAEQLTPAEHARLAGEGYAPALPGVEPAVIPYTTAVAAAAVGELLERLVGYGPQPVPGELLLRLHDREISTNRAAPRPHHYCDPGADKLGTGEGDPFLGVTWAS